MTVSEKAALAALIADWLSDQGAYVDDLSQYRDLTDVLVDASGGDYLDLTDLAATILTAVLGESEWEFGVVYTEPLNGDRETALFRSLSEAREFMTGDTTSGNSGHQMLGRRRRVGENGWEPLASDTP